MEEVNKRVIILRHGEQAIYLDKKMRKEDSEIGLTKHGATRACYTPQLVQKLLDLKTTDTYDIHTYTHDKGFGPVSRSYFTALPLMGSEKCRQAVLYKKSGDIQELADNIKSSTAKIIIVFWEHKQIPMIIKQLFDLNETDTPNYNKVCKSLKEGLKNDKFEVIDTIKIKPKKVKRIVRCNQTLSKDNFKIDKQWIKNDLAYSLVWDAKFYDSGRKQYIVYPGIIIENKSTLKMYKNS
jgi:hypothetical protein